MAFLCFNHHDTYDSTTSTSKNFTKNEVKSYRYQLYKWVENVFEPSRPPIVNIQTNIIVGNKRVEKANFIKLINKNLRPLKYSFLVMKKLPVYEKTKDVSAYAPYNSPFNLRRIVSNREFFFIIFHPIEADKKIPRNKILSFKIHDLYVQNDNISRFFTSQKELGLFFELIEYCDEANERLMEFWLAGRTLIY